MNEAWPTVKLGDIAEVTSSKRIKMADYVNSGVPFYRSKEIIERAKGSSISTELFITEEYFSAIDQKFGSPSQGDILLTSVGTLGIPYQVKEGDRFYFKDGNLTWFRNYKPDINADFLLCWLTSSIAKRRFDEVTIGSTQKALTIIALKSIEITLPPLVEQKAIASLLGALDDKTENNRRMNETLEEMARAIFKSWFVDFDPVHAKAAGNAPVHMDAETAALFPSSFGDDGLPRGWEKSIIGNEVEIFGGGTPSTKEAIYWEGGEFNWCTPKDLSPLVSPVLLSTSRKITESGLKKISSGLLPKGTLLMSSRAPVGYLAISQIPVAVNQGFIAMKCSKRISNLYALFWCEQNMEKIKNNAGGSTFAEISKSNFKPIPIICSNEKVVTAFDSYVEPMFSKVVLNLKENQTLAELRDTLLPKLMSGEIRVADAEREVAAAV
jgi:type I restriction enzyme, S subunit